MSNEIVNPVITKVHPKFREMVFEIINERVKRGKETSQKQLSFSKVTKIIYNAIESNPELYEKIVEVDINV